MLLYKDRHINKKWQIAVWKITETVEELSSLVNDTAIVSYANEHFAGVKRRCEWLATRLLVKELLGQNAQIEYDQTGRPYIKDIPSISISHTDGYVAVIISYNLQVGIDIERRNRFLGETYKRFMNEQECAVLEDKNRNDVMLVHWTAKEALFKIVGNLGGTFKDNISLSHFKYEKNGVVNLYLRNVVAIHYTYKVEYCVNEMFVMSVCYPL